MPSELKRYVPSSAVTCLATVLVDNPNLFLQDIPVQRGDFLITITGLSSNFRCENSKHGKLVVPEELVQTEMKEKQRRVEERQRKEEELARLHEGMKAARVVNPSGSCVDSPDSHHSESRPPAIYDIMPGAGNKQPDVIVIAPESQDSTKHQFVIGSRVKFSDPPRYGEICWMGNFPQVNGLIAGVELVSCHL